MKRVILEERMAIPDHLPDHPVWIYRVTPGAREFIVWRFACRQVRAGQYVGPLHR